MKLNNTVKVAIMSILGQGMAQGINAVTGLLRIPILVVALSASGYGTFTLVQSVVPWLLVLPTGLRYSLRVMGADAAHSADWSEGQLLDTHLLEARRLVCWMFAWGTPSSVVIALVWPGLASPSKNPLEAFTTLVLLLLLVASSFSGAVYTGWLEVHSRNGLVNVLGAATGIGGLILTFALWRTNAPFNAFAIAGGAASVAPAWCGWIVGKSVGKREAAPSNIIKAVRKNNRGFVFATLANLLAAGLAPFVIGLILGPESVAAHAIAARLAVIVTIIPTALTPILWNHQARLRSQSALGSQDVTTTFKKILIISGATGLFLSIVFIIVGPWIGHRLGAQSVATPLALYLAFGAHGFLQFLVAPLSASLTGPRGVAYMARTTASAAGVSAMLSVPATCWLGVSGPVWSGALGFGLLCVAWLRRIHLEGSFLDDSHLST